MSTTRRRSRRSAGAGPDGPTPGSAADDAAEPDPVSVARSIVLRKLTVAPRSRAQLAGDLAAREVPDDVAEAVLDRFTEVGLVDDAAFAEVWVRTRHAGRGLSRSALRRELRAKGVEDETIAEAVDTIDDDAEESAARALVARRLASTRGLPVETRLRRLVGQLARKGYPGGLAMRVVRDALAAEAAGVQDQAPGLDEEIDDGPGRDAEAVAAAGDPWRPSGP
ncbi:MAG: regulatory protein RecX [Sporichthyaceae bacterium]